MSKKVVVVGATIQCSHKGEAPLLNGDKRLQISKQEARDYVRLENFRAQTT